MRDDPGTATLADRNAATTSARLGYVAGVAALVCFGVDGLPLAVAAPGLMSIARADYATHRVPNRLLAVTTVGVGATAMAATAVGGDDLVPAILVAGAWLAVLLAVHVLDPRLGFGDVKLGGVLGFVLGWSAHTAGLHTAAAAGFSAIVFLAACVTTLLVGRRAARSTAVPFAPALVAATLIGVIVMATATLL